MNIRTHAKHGTTIKFLAVEERQLRATLAILRQVEAFDNPLDELAGFAKEHLVSFMYEAGILSKVDETPEADVNSAFPGPPKDGPTL